MNIAKSSLLFLILLGATSISLAQGQGSIVGHVVDEQGLPVSGARVYADKTQARAGNSFLRHVETDLDGHYIFERLDWGEYQVFAEKESAGYPNLHWSFYENHKLPRITLSSESSAASIEIKLGPKAGTLNGSITNAVTGAPTSATFKMTRVHFPEAWISTSVASHYEVLLPSSTDVRVEVTAPGFEPYIPKAPMRLEPGATMELDISMQPVRDGSLHPSRFLIPDGYVGWLQLEYNAADKPQVPTDGDGRIYKFPDTGVLVTASAGPDVGVEGQYFFYEPDGALRAISSNYKGGGGKVWGSFSGSKAGVMCLFGFFVGTEEQYKKYMSLAMHPGPIRTADQN